MKVLLCLFCILAVSSATFLSGKAMLLATKASLLEGLSGSFGGQNSGGRGQRGPPPPPPQRHIVKIIHAEAQANAEAHGRAYSNSGPIGHGGPGLQLGGGEQAPIILRIIEEPSGPGLIGQGPSGHGSYGQLGHGSSGHGPINQGPPPQIIRIIHESSAQAHSSANAVGHGNGNGYASGHSTAHASGHASGHATGHATGHASGYSAPHEQTIRIIHVPASAPSNHLNHAHPIAPPSLTPQLPTPLLAAPYAPSHNHGHSHDAIAGAIASSSASASAHAPAPVYGLPPSSGW